MRVKRKPRMWENGILGIYKKNLSVLKKKTPPNYFFKLHLKCFPEFLKVFFKILLNIYFFIYLEKHF